MSPDRGRASKACTACRKQKTRCYESGRNGGACLRCERLRQPCSLEVPTTHSQRGSGSHDNENGDSYNDRLSRLERTVNTLVERLGENPALTRTPSNASASHPNFANQPEPTNLESVSSAGPVFVIRDVATEVGVRQHEDGTTRVVAGQESHDIIASGLLKPQEASSLLILFHEHYGRWVAFNETTSPESLLAEVRKSPLLLCACCLIAVRHTTQESASKLAPPFFQNAKSLISMGLLVVPQSFAFFQAALVLSLWSTTIGETPLSIDSWLLSGFALQHALASDIFAPITGTSRSSSITRRDLERWCVWNHLCLVHLHYCVGTRRRAQLDRKQIDKCRQILDSDHTTNFEYRMVAEINLYWIIYESCSTLPVDLPRSQAVLHTWSEEWKFLFAQPRSQFLQMGFYFAQLLLYDQSLKSRSAAVRESLLSEMVRLSAAILTLAMDTADVRTRHLSDHIYHVITFAAVTLCRLLHMYEDQLASTHNISELDQLILTLVDWLRSIGLPCHVAHTLGDVVSAFHEKLRPSARPTPSYEADFDMEPDFTHLFPEFLGIESFDGGNESLLPDWQDFIPASTS